MKWLADRTNRARRSCATLLLAVFLLPFLALSTSLPTDEDTTLPACCRAHGKHHCSMGRVATEASTTRNGGTVSQISDRCPFQGSGPAPHPPGAYGAPTILPQRADVFSESLTSSGCELSAVYETFHVHPKRGPPISSDTADHA